jgi:hypothetical protein
MGWEPGPQPEVEVYVQGASRARAQWDMKRRPSSQLLHLREHRKARFPQGLVPNCIGPDQAVASVAVDVGLCRYLIGVRTKVEVGEERP